MSGKIDSPWYIPISDALVMRHAAETKADIEVFDNYLLLRMKQDPEEMIELTRFLGIFRSQRAKLQLILSKWKGENVYYNYQFYVFSRMFESLTKTPQHYYNDLDKLHRHYLIDLSLFWQYSNNKILSVVYGFKAALAYVELVDLVKYLAYMYENDSSILMSYAEICLIALGDPKASVKYRRISSMIKDSPTACEDPIFRHVSRFYPLSVNNYQSENYYSTSDSNSNSSSTESFSKLRFHINENVIFRDEKSDNSSVAMFVRKCTDLRTFGIILSCIFIFVMSMLYLKKLRGLTNEKFENLEGLKLMISQTIEVAYRLTSGVLLYDQLEQNKNLDCKEFIKKVYNHLKNYPISYKDDYFFLAKVWGTTSQILSDQMINNCNLFDNHSTIIFQQLHQILINYNFFQGNLSNILHSTSLSCMYKKAMIITFLMSFVCVIISIGFVYFGTRLLLTRFPKEAKEFLGSRERLSLLLLKKSLESWDLFKLNFKSMKEEVKQTPQIEKSPRRIKVGHKFSSETNLNLNCEQKSRHVDLKDGKISISFIGADQLLKPSQFALMSPFVFSPTPKASDSSDVEEDEKLIPSEKLENLNLISKTIEKTKDTYKYRYLYIVIMFFLPWAITLILMFFGRIVIFFENDVTKIYLTRIDQNATELSKLPYAIYYNFKNKSIQQINFNQNLSWYRRNLMQIIEDADQIHKSIIISRHSFLIVASFFWILAMYGCFVVEESIKRGYESLFHFPIGLMNDIILQNDTKSESSMTNEIIEVSVNKETNNIICVTSNCLDVIGEEPLNIIGHKYDEIFAKNDRLRLYNLTSKKVKKFVECCYEMEKINKYALYDVSTYLTTKTAMMNLMQSNIPKNFAEEFCEKQKQSFRFSNSYTIIVKFDSSDYSMSTDNFFKAVSNMLQCYITVKFIKYEGSLCYFICPTCERVIPFLFVRDLIANSRPSSRIKLVQSKSAVLSAIILRSDVKYNLEFGEEPYLSSNLNFSPFFAKDETIAVLDKEQFLIRLDDLEKFISAV
ncbi:hypothetical protein TVAG_071830 [Trichomonas vaginalis G3]|uniref:Uncharacterized protein n=1 Tax=Trichomonas vaginalis (strain ATCC PRA-98 / G3) TaxID=412133 RepID=A2D886_TRIV3|nr:hypothetical protein TVAGG3_1046940 [Trichomonas vaginalis G3]EAY23519.1 hypothetical protein TVAG_071830 [Trichomonas vaginalis G3]KAI5493941.1 hypothetical protein TVAGG3_1046940 [Trichomonas vaginalis G3]|eukprot:XP_001584505.1 hypothetical protein [Trichomonas vaginalis G3]